MNLTEKILAKLDKTINDIEFFLSKPRETDSIVELARTHLPVLYALRRQVEKHNELWVIGGYKQVVPGCTECFDMSYPCIFNTEVATDLGIEVEK
jgi:hypothetical protein